MTENNHPITPPPELIEDWIEIAKPRPQRPPNPGELAALAARWGADQELEACCHLLRQQGFDVVDDLRATRRPKPPSLKEQALELVDRLEKAESPWVVMSELATIRRALEQLDD
jgi:hypothetical protein